MLSDKDDPGWSMYRGDGFSPTPLNITGDKINVINGEVEIDGFVLTLTTDPRGKWKRVNWAIHDKEHRPIAPLVLSADRRGVGYPDRELLLDLVEFVLGTLPPGSYFYVGEEYQYGPYPAPPRYNIFGIEPGHFDPYGVEPESFIGDITRIPNHLVYETAWAWQLRKARALIRSAEPNKD